MRNSSEASSSIVRKPAVAQVVDVVDVPLALPQVEDVADGVDVVLGVQGHPVFRNVLIELAVDPEPADLAQAVAVGIEKLLVKELAGLFQLRGIARPQPLVDPQESTLVIGGRVFLKRLENQRVARILEDADRAQIAGVGQHLRMGLGDRRAAVDQDLAGGGVDDIAAGDAPLELGGRLGIGRVDVFGFVERLKDRLVARIGRAHRTQQGHRRELARLVDPHAQGVFLGDLQLDPTAALGDDPAGMQLLVARLDLDDEIDAGRAVELADDDPLGTVDDELAAADHDGHVTQVDRFLEGGLALVEPEPDVERPAVGQAELAALVGVVARLAQVVVEILELERLVVTLDRENLAEDPFQPGVAALVDRQVGLEEPLVASRLDLRQIRNGKIIGDPAEVAFLGRDNSPHGSRCGHVIALLMGRRECKRAGRSASPDRSCTPRYPVAANHVGRPRGRAGRDQCWLVKGSLSCAAGSFEGSPRPGKPPRPPA